MRVPFLSILDKICEQKGLKLCQLNIRSLLPKLDELEFTLLDGSLDFVGFTESWLHANVHDSMLFKKGFHVERQDRVNGKRGGGLCCYIKDSIEYTRLARHVNNSDAEIMSVVMRRSHQKNILIILVYRPPQGNVKIFLETLRNYINDLRDTSSMNLVILGDFNIDYSKKSDGNTKKLMNLEKEFLLEQVIQEPTRIAYNKSSLIDLMFTDLKFVSYANPLQINLSDHLPTVLVYKKNREVKNPTEITIRDMSEANITEFKQALSDHNWSYVFEETTNVNILWERMYSDIVLLLNLHCPFKTIRIKNNRPEYITDCIIEQMHIRDKLFKKARKSNCVHDWIDARRQRQIVNYAVRKSKSDYLKNKIKLAKGDSKKFWTSIRSLLPKLKGKNIVSVIDHQSNEELFETKAANFINEYFCTIGTKLVKDIPVSDPPCIANRSYVVTTSHDFIWSQDVEEKEVLKEIENLDVSKSSGFMEMNTRIFKIAFKILLKEYTRIINLCKQLNSFPNSWKYAITVPIPKKGDAKSVNNMRPISLLPVAGKVLERFINNHIMEHMEGNGFFAKCQGGFRKGKSTIHTVYNLIKYVWENRNNKKYVASIYLDLAKAFNTIDHEILLEKLKKLNFSDKFTLFIKSYLSERKQRIKLGNIFSELNTVPEGVPQGSIVGPSLFLIYVNDMENVKFNGVTHLYADDTVISYAADTVDDLVLGLRDDLANFYKWSVLNKLTINIAKSKILPYGTKTQGNFLEGRHISLNNTDLGIVNKYVYLGVKLNSGLDFNEHACHLYKSALQMSYSLYKIRSFIDSKSAVIIFKAFILSRLEYGSIFCVMSNASVINKLQKLVNRCLRTCFKLPGDSNVFQLHTSAKLLPLSVRRNIQLMKLMYSESKDVNNMLPRNRIGIRSNRCPIFCYSVPKSEAYKRSVIFQGPSRWEKLPVKLKLAPSIEEFDSEIKKYYLENFLSEEIV